jgi:hypothetical protein
MGWHVETSIASGKIYRLCGCISFSNIAWRIGNKIARRRSCRMRYLKGCNTVCVVLALVLMVWSTSCAQDKKKPLEKIRVAYNM